jgi:hypothetical protein
VRRRAIFQRILVVLTLVSLFPDRDLHRAWQGVIEIRAVRDTILHRIQAHRLLSILGRAFFEEVRGSRVPE